LILKSGEDMAPLSVRNADRSVLTRRTMEQIAKTNDRQWQSNRKSESEDAARTTVKARWKKTDRTRERELSVKKKPAPDSSRESQSKAKINLSRLPRGTAKFLEPMKALLVEAIPQGPHWIYEVKFDGVRALAIKTKNQITLLSRTNKELTKKYSPVAEGLAGLRPREFVLDGEIVAVDENGRSDFQLLQSYEMAGGDKPPLFYYAFDLLEVDGKDYKSLALWQRKAILEQMLKEGSSTIRFSQSIRGDSERLVREMQKRGLEGLVAKQRESKYLPGVRGHGWAKIKWTREQEFVIGGYTEPQGSRTHFGAVLVGYYEKGKLIFAGKVGTGFNEKMLGMLNRTFAKLQTKDCPFANLPEKPVTTSRSKGLTAREMRRCTWLKPQLVCQVRFAEWTRDNHLRQPSFLGLREDRKPREVVKEKPA